MPKYDVNVEETLQPVGLAHQQPQAEVIVVVTGDGRQAGQGGEFGSDEVDETLYQCTVVEMALEFCIGKVAFQGYEMNAVAIA